MGLDPGLRTGVKVAVVDATGKGLGYHGNLSPCAPQRLGRFIAHWHNSRLKHQVAFDRYWQWYRFLARN